MSRLAQPAAVDARTIAGVLLAGGLSQRMGGGDKCLRLLGGRSLLDHAMNRMRPQVGTLLLSANGDPQRFRVRGLTVVPDLTAARLGPLAGILAAMHWVRHHRPEIGWIATAATDTPFLPTDLVEQLSASPVAAPIRLATSRGRVHPVAGLWPVWVADELQSWLESGSGSVLRFAELSGFAEIAFPDRGPVDPFFNVNTPGDLTAAAQLLQSSVAPSLVGSDRRREAMPA